MVRVKNNGKCGLIDSSGKVIIPFEFDDVLSFKNGLAPVKKNGKWGFIDSKNKLILPYRYDGASSFINGMARVRLAELTGMIDKKGKEIIPLQFQHITYLSDYILVNDERAFGLLDKKEIGYCPVCMLKLSW